MFFELSVAFKYLIPRWRQLSVSVISLISILVIALVVWLIVVFFSVTHGLEKGWIHKLIALTAPVRIGPTKHYYRSYYYLIDSISANSNYSVKSIGEKLTSPTTDPYNRDFDQEIPASWPARDLDGHGQLKDPVKLAFSAIKNLHGISGNTAKDYEMTIATIKLALIRGDRISLSQTWGTDVDQSTSSLTQATYLGSYDSENVNLAHAMLPPTKEDIQNLIDTINEEFIPSSHYGESPHDAEQAKERLKKLLGSVQIQSVRVKPNDFNLYCGLLPDNCHLKVVALKVGKKINSVLLPHSPDEIEMYVSLKYMERVEPIIASLDKKDGQTFLTFESKEKVPLDPEVPLFLGKELIAEGEMTTAELERNFDVSFVTSVNVQGITLKGTIPLNRLKVNSFKIRGDGGNSPWIFDHFLPENLPSDNLIGEAILLPKSFKEGGALLGDRGYLSYQAPTATSVQEQRIPIYVAGFYDPGILPFGGKISLANSYITAMIRSAYPNDESPLSNGINVRFDNIQDAEEVKQQLERAFIESGIDAYWNVETFRHFEFTKDFLQQLRSDKNLFTLISTIVIIVACSNIISMLIILVNNKKMEIGVLRSMGATSWSIALIFGLCGITMGIVGSSLGLVVALITLRNLQSLINLISKLQGFQAFNPVFYGDTLPNEISFEALVFVIGATAAISLVAGVIPAIKASLMQPSAILRSE